MIFHRQMHFTLKSECVKFKTCHESCLFPAEMHNSIRNGLGEKKSFSVEVVLVCVSVPGPQTVDLMPVCSRLGTLLIAPSICCMNTSQSRSNKLKANLSDTWDRKHNNKYITFLILYSHVNYVSHCKNTLIYMNRKNTLH